MAFPVRPEEVEIDWLDARLREAGVLHDAKLSGIEWQAIGTGQVGDSIRFALSYDRAEAGPPTIAGKFASSDPVSKGTAQALKLYVHEVGFYRDCAARLPIRTPRPIFADIDETGGDFIVLMEDLGPARQGNQLASCSPDDARAAIAQAAALHGPSWGDDALMAQAWAKPDEQAKAMVAALYPKSTETFLSRYADQLEPQLRDTIERMGAASSRLLTRANPHKSLVHGDFRLDNMLFDICGGAEPLAVVDWQTVGPGDGMVDVGYFMGAGIAQDMRSEIENDLLDLYCAGMARHGVALNRADIAEGYAMGALHGVSTAVFSAANVVRTERGDAIFLAMARGAGELARDCGALELLEN